MNGLVVQCRVKLIGKFVIIVTDIVSLLWMDRGQGNERNYCGVERIQC